MIISRKTNVTDGNLGHCCMSKNIVDTLYLVVWDVYTLIFKYKIQKTTVGWNFVFIKWFYWTSKLIFKPNIFLVQDCQYSVVPGIASKQNSFCKTAFAGLRFVRTKESLVVVAHTPAPTGTLIKVILKFLQLQFTW